MPPYSNSKSTIDLIYGAPDDEDSEQDVEQEVEDLDGMGSHNANGDSCKTSEPIRRPSAYVRIFEGTRNNEYTRSNSHLDRHSERGCELRAASPD